MNRVYKLPIKHRLYVYTLTMCTVENQSPREFYSNKIINLRSLQSLCAGCICNAIVEKQRKFSLSVFTAQTHSSSWVKLWREKQAGTNWTSLTRLKLTGRINDFRNQRKQYIKMYKMWKIDQTRLTLLITFIFLAAVSSPGGFAGKSLKCSL